MIIRKMCRYQIIVQDIIDQITCGTLQPGDYLLPYRKLMTLYRVSEASLTRALQELEARGLIERRRRAFCRVSQLAASRLQSHKAGVAATLAEETHTRLKHLVHYNPCARRKMLRLFLTDGYPEHLAAWRDVLAEFRKQHPALDIRIDSAGAASVERASQADVVQAVPWLIEDLRLHGFEPLEAEVLQPAISQLLAPAREFVTCGGSTLGAMFEMMPVAIAVNETLASSSRHALNFDSVPALEESILQAVQSQALRSCAGAHFGTLFGLMLHHGAFWPDSEGFLNYDPEAAQQVVDRFTKLASLENGLWTGSDSILFSGGLLAYYGGMYLAIALRRPTTSVWSVKPVPVAGAGRSLIMPILLAVRKDSPLRTTCEELVRHLCSLDSQIRFGMTGGSLPVLQGAIAHQKVKSALPLKETELQRVIETGTLLAKLKRENCWLEHAVDQIGQAIADHTVQPEAAEAMVRIARAVQQYRQLHDQPELAAQSKEEWP